MSWPVVNAVAFRLRAASAAGASAWTRTRLKSAFSRDSMKLRVECSSGRPWLLAGTTWCAGDASATADDLACTVRTEMAWSSGCRSVPPGDCSLRWMVSSSSDAQVAHWRWMSRPVALFPILRCSRRTG